MNKVTYVYIVDKFNKPLMPTTNCGYIRKLLRTGKAVAISNNPFTVKLKYETTSITQDLTYCIDSGRENIGVAVVKENGDCVHLYNLETKNKTIKKKMEERKQYRQARRYHKRQRKQRRAIRSNTYFKQGVETTLRSKKPCYGKEVIYPKMGETVVHKVCKGKEPKYNNRRSKQGLLSPSARQLLDCYTLSLKQDMKFLPITKLVIENNCFDIQKLENADIEPVQYQKGILYGFKDYKDYINKKQGNKCLLCSNKIEHYHHIVPKHFNGSNNVENIVGLCLDCHKKVHTDSSYQYKLLQEKQGLRKKYEVSLLNSIMLILLETLETFCKENNIDFYVTNGYETSNTRNLLQLEKDHCIDAYCMNIVAYNNLDYLLENIDSINFSDITRYKRRFKKKSNNIISKYNKREYLYKGNVVACNRHKALEQKEDSLEEYRDKYLETHTEKEWNNHFEELEVIPCRRIYTYHKKGLKSPMRVGDIIKYRKETRKCIKQEIFVATKVVVSTSTVANGNKGRLFKYCSPLVTSSLAYV